MEFMNRAGRQEPVNTQVTQDGGVVTHAQHPSPRRNRGLPSWLKLTSVALLFSGTILVVALVWLVVLGGPAKESNYVDDDRMQAVFLNGGQVYFGRIKDLNDKYMRLEDIYYLRVNQQVQPREGDAQPTQNEISLVKLGCELHGPEDEMLLNREQVIFWENLKDDGQVADAVKRYQDENPDGQKCDAPQQTNTNTNNSSQTQQNNDEENTNTNTNNR